MILTYTTNKNMTANGRNNPLSKEKYVNKTTLLLFVLLLVFFAHLATGQRNERQKTGAISGQVIDAASNQPVEYATVSVFSRRDSALVTGTVSNEKGEFNVDQIPAGAYRVKISYIGYRTSTKENLQIDGQEPVKNLGIIKLNASSQALQEVVVSAEQPVFEQSIDKKVFNVEKNIVSLGGSATDILETVPSIAVDADGGISLRGSGGVVILIDGKPSSLTGADRAAILEQIPASAIESIEIITNPSSKYDAEGMSGIINIVLKKNQVKGSNGLVTLSAGTRDKYNASINLNHRTPKFNIFTNYSYRYNSRFFRGYRENFRSNTPSGADYLSQQINGLDVDKLHMIRAGVDYYLNQKTTIGISGLYRTDKENEGETLDYREANVNRDLLRLYQRFNTGIEDGNNVDIALNFQRTFVKPQQELTASAQYSAAKEAAGSDFSWQFYNPDFTPLAFDSLQRNSGDLSNRLITIQADYVQPLFENGKLEAGYKSIIRQVDNNFVFEDFNNEVNDWINNAAISNNFLFNEQVHSLYSNYSSTIGRFGYQAGLRLEQTLTNSVQKTTDQAFENNYLNLFPSIFLSYKLKNEQQWQLNYSRRINRPWIRQLNPFVDFSDPSNLRFGNPRLQPELTNAFELSYQKGWKNLFLTSSVYYRNTNDIIQRIISFPSDTANVSTTTFQNLASRNTYGFEFIARNTFTKWWNVTSNFNFFRTVVDGTNLGETNFNNANVSWSLMFISNMNIPNIAQVQITANYRGPMATAQGIMREMYGINVGIKRDILKEKGTISLNVSDIFDTREFRMRTSGVVANGEVFSQLNDRKRETRIATLTFTYKFGRLQDRKRQESEGRDRSQDGDEDFF